MLTNFIKRMQSSVKIFLSQVHVNRKLFAEADIEIDRNHRLVSVNMAGPCKSKFLLIETDHEVITDNSRKLFCCKTSKIIKTLKKLKRLLLRTYCWCSIGLIGWMEHLGGCCRCLDSFLVFWLGLDCSGWLRRERNHLLDRRALCEAAVMRTDEQPC